MTSGSGFATAVDGAVDASQCVDRWYAHDTSQERHSRRRATHVAKPEHAFVVRERPSEIGYLESHDANARRCRKTKVRSGDAVAGVIHDGPGIQRF